MNEINVVKESFVFPTKHLPKCFSNLSLYDKLDDIYNSYNGIEEILSDNFEKEDIKDLSVIYQKLRM